MRQIKIAIPAIAHGTTMAIIIPVLKTLSAVCDTVILYSQSTNKRIKIRWDYVKYQTECE